MLKKLMPQKVENSELGYIVQSVDREHVEYVEADRRVAVEVDRGATTGIYTDSICVWETATGEQEMSRDEIVVVVKRVNEAMQFMGINTELLS